MLQRAVLNADAAVISAADLPSSIASPEIVAAGGSSERPTLDVLERRYVALVLTEMRGNQSRAAAVLGISRKALWEKRKRYGMD